MTARTNSSTTPVVALIAAAGRGTRLGAEIPKAYVQLRGRSLLERSVTAMETSEIVDRIGVIVSPDMEPHARQLLRGHDVQFIHGAGERADSVWEGLKALSLIDATVLIHDAARALTPPGMIARVAREVLDGAPAVVPVLPVADTIKHVTDDGATVLGTPDRATLRAVQTPQGFDLATLRAANEKYFAQVGSAAAGFTATDDASLMEWFGVPVTTVQGDPMAFKITTPIDLVLAERITEEAEPTVFDVPGS
ncbi:2-C-methyl-D-erythritol 4-phosphate cytidylyltransferase [Corynebacterium urinipleomorphum]|uniref:2-C-methyl-D-erythritol 4-phosphate cytidylyltransferase n=1 Tax=Corynebacterium urinipleomorphum TaxID=1852380 RepID=UPI000B3573B6|nr:2-C-methyl-D-erythritol 4-phosphate cytidylyltransferase [Corynebacterium urinipleomorphum]